MQRPLLLLFILAQTLLLTACGEHFAVVDPKGYSEMARYIPDELTGHALPTTQDAVRDAVDTRKESFGQILFRQLSPEFMQGETAQYYIGETFEKTIQPRRSTVRHSQNGFTIEHVSQRVTVSMLARGDWDGDGRNEWIVSCTVVPRRGTHQKTWYLLVPPPLDSTEILKGTPAAVLDCAGGSCTVQKRDASRILRTRKDSMPLTEVKEFTPGQETITTPPSEQKAPESIRERSL